MRTGIRSLLRDRCGILWGTISAHGYILPVQNTCTTSENNCKDPALPAISWPRVMPDKSWEEVWDSSPSGSKQAATILSKGRVDTTSRTIDIIHSTWGLYQRPAL
ncbi:MAG: hypothetical protein HFG16_03815 [Erysipelotrichaceae bacterium]|jgi:hypothetical protein|nr:hypothetical protein [Erysipelotrichaceae bacterium]